MSLSPLDNPRYQIFLTWENMQHRELANLSKFMEPERAQLGFEWPSPYPWVQHSQDMQMIKEAQKVQEITEILLNTLV